MNTRTARQILLARRPDGRDDESPGVKEALAAIATDASLSAECEEARIFDRGISADLLAIALPEGVAEQIDDAREEFSGSRHGGSMAMGRPAALAVGFGFLLLIAVLVWNFLGRAGTFPDDAMKISGSGEQASADEFDSVDDKVGELQDWFMLKGFDNFRVPQGVETFSAVGARIFKVEGEPVAQVAVSEHRMFFYAFAAQPFGIQVVPEGAWRFAEDDGNALAIREEGGICFLITMHGSKRELQKLLGK